MTGSVVALIALVITTVIFTLSVTVFKAGVHGEETPDLSSRAPSDAFKPARRTILFDLDQGFESGIIEQQEVVYLNRMLDVMQKFELDFDVFAVLHPITASSSKLRAVLHRLAEKNIRFVLDVYTSDAMAVGNVRVTANEGADVPHGIAMSLPALQALKQDPQLGPVFAGLRIMEVMSGNFTVNNCRTRREGPSRVNWCDHFIRNLPTDAFFQPDRFARPLLDFAKANGMWVLWSDWKWDAQTTSEQQALRSLVAPEAYRDMLVLGYANNLPGESARFDMSDWERWRVRYQPLVGTQILALALSDQSWTCDNQMGCPVQVLIDWAILALSQGVQILEFEPSWYFFELPRPDDKHVDKDLYLRIGGRPTDQLAILAAALGVDLVSREPRPKSATAPDEASCLALDAPKLAGMGQEFRAFIRFRNTGTGRWLPAGHSVAAPQPGWHMQNSISLPSPVESGGEFSITAVVEAPTSRGAKRLEFQMTNRRTGPFGQPCSILIQVE
jgi:hypothetical protein